MMSKFPSKFIAIILTCALIITSFGIAPEVYAEDAADTEGPKIDLDSISISKKVLDNPYEFPMLKMKITDESGIG